MVCSVLNVHDETIGPTPGCARRLAGTYSTYRSLHLLPGASMAVEWLATAPSISGEECGGVYLYIYIYLFIGLCICKWIFLSTKMYVCIYIYIFLRWIDR